MSAPNKKHTFANWQKAPHRPGEPGQKAGSEAERAVSISVTKPLNPRNPKP